MDSLIYCTPLVPVVLLALVARYLLAPRCPNCGGTDITPAEEAIRGLSGHQIRTCKSCDLTKGPEDFRPSTPEFRATSRANYESGGCAWRLKLALGLALIFGVTVMVYLTVR